MATQSARSSGGWRSTVWGEYLAEFFGTFILMAVGDSVVAMTVAALNQSGRGTDFSTAAGSGLWVVIVLGWGLAVALAVYAAGGITGAHINPAVTLAFAVKRDFPWGKVPGYMIAQILGAFVGGALTFLLYHDAIASFENANNIVRGALGGPGDSTATFSIFATFPAPYFGTSLIGPLIDQIIGTAFLVGLILALVDERNQPPKSNVAPIVVGLVVVLIGCAFGANAGYAINPARDFGPRVFAWLAGWGQVALPGINYYFWVPIVGPLIGGVLGALAYDFFIGNVLVARGAQPDPEIDATGETDIETTEGESAGDARSRGRTVEQ
ncbi:MAG: MIP family channel protein [Actinobacteria bacterium]|jgi:glycerol uptake facilitator protein|nr:MIP family channel protein [Actinomycetota bacterium]MCA1740319.1 MIP family channel protein [Actinomycetota bacterium]